MTSLTFAGSTNLSPIYTSSGTARYSYLILSSSSLNWVGTGQRSVSSSTSSTSSVISFQCGIYCGRNNLQPLRSDSTEIAVSEEATDDVSSMLSSTETRKTKYQRCRYSTYIWLHTSFPFVRAIALFFTLINRAISDDFFCNMSSA